jgi:hypothetical protein
MVLETGRTDKFQGHSDYRDDFELKYPGQVSRESAKAR